jgi:hypothetical protein
MDDLDLIRRVTAEDDEPDDGARERVAARVESGIEARAADERHAQRRSSRPERRRTPVNRRRLTLVAVVAAVLVAAAVFAAGDLLHPNAAQASVEFSNSDGYIVAMVTDPFAAQDRLRAAFAAHGLDIDLKLVPVSPSIVGSVVYLDGAGIQTLFGSKYDGPKGELPIGLRIPTDFKGHAQIVLGRPAKPGEEYTSAGDAFAPGEALHGVDLVGISVADAASLLQKKGLQVEWRVDVPMPADEVPAKEKAATVTPTPTPTAAAGSAATPAPVPTAVPEGGSDGTVMYSLAVDGAGIHKYDAYFVTGAVAKGPGSVYVFTAAEPRTKQ